MQIQQMIDGHRSIISTMPVIITKPHWTQRIAPWFAGFDPWLLLAFGLLASLGMVAMYSIGFDYGNRVVDHSRNLIVALAVMLVFSQIPPHRLRMAAVPL